MISYSPTPAVTKMFKILAASALFAVVASAGTLSGHAAKSLPILGAVETRRVLGGTETIIERIPYQVSIQIQGIHYCGGSIISEYWVLTAAHCYKDTDLFTHYQYTIRAGTRDNTNGGSVHRVDHFVPHEGFVNKNNYPNDIALYRVHEPFIFDATRQPVTLYERGDLILEGDTAFVSGWGNGTSSERKHILNVLEVSVISRQKCNARRPDPVAGQFCAEHKDPAKRFCKGDSGGPLTVNGRLAGVVSLGGTCEPSGTSSIYAEVPYYRDWIRQNSGV